jgi:hypothetical protein
MKRIGVLGVVALLLLPLGAGTGADRELPLRGPQAETAVPVAVVPDGSDERLAHLDSATLTPVAPIRLIGAIEAWAASPDGRLLALGVSSDTQDEHFVVRFANVGSLRLVRRGLKLDGWLAAASWPTLSRMVALVGSQSDVAVETIDTVGKTIVRREALGGIAGPIVRFAGGFVLLVEQPNQIAPASLAVVGTDGSVRTVRLDRILAGWSWPRDAGADPIGTARGPGLAVDPAGTAYVLDASGLVAAVDLAGLVVSYHILHPASLLTRLADWLSPPAEAKGLNGPQRSATWLGDGLIALTGADYTATRAKDGSESFGATPAGLAVVDVQSWTLRMLDADATDASVADGALLTTGGGWTSSGRGSGTGLAAYQADGTMRWRLFPGTRPSVAGVVGRLALVQEDGNGRYDVIDTATGRTLRSGVGQAPWPLVGSGS